MDSSSDFFIARPRPDAAMRLLCFPHAGGASTTFYSWITLLEPEIECVCLQFPGRGQRFRETPLNSIADIAHWVTSRIERFCDKPFAFYGHSFGGWLAFEVARLLRHLGMPGPQHFFVGASRPPHLPPIFEPIHMLPESEFIEAIQVRYGGIPAAIYSDREVLNIFTAAMRADFTAYELHSMKNEAPLRVPITAFAGEEDPAVTPGSMQEWAVHTDAEFELKVLQGGHFFPPSSIATLIETIRERSLLRVPKVGVAAQGANACR